MFFALAGACLWAWLDLGAYGTVLTDASEVEGTLASIYPLIVFAASAATALAASLARRSYLDVLKTNGAMTSAALAGAAGTLGIVFGGQASSSALVIASSLAQGFSLGLLSLVFCAAATRMRGAVPMGLLMAGSTLLGLPLDLLIVALQKAFLPAALAILPVTCALFSHFALNASSGCANPNGDQRSTHSTDGNPAEDPPLLASLRRYRALIVFIATFSLMHGFLEYFTLLSPFENDSDSSVLLIARFTAMAAVFLLLRFRRVRIDLVLRTGIVIGVAGFLLISDSLFLPPLRSAGTFFAAAGYALFDVIAWSLLAETSYYTPGRSKRFIAFCLFAWQGCTFAGSALGLAAETVVEPGAATGIIASSIAACIVGVSVYFMGSELWLAVRYGSSFADSEGSATRIQNALEPQGTNEPSGQSLRISSTAEAAVPEPRISFSHDDANFKRSAPASFQGTAARHMLTKRELDILAYLVRGRSIPYIAEAECISENTVRSHTKNIYAKFNVHTKQELIDAVEREANGS